MIKKKTYFKASISSVIFQTLLTIGMVLYVIFFVILLNSVLYSDNVEKMGFAAYLLMSILAIGLLLSLYLELTFLIGNIKTNGKRIYTKGDIRMPREKLQYPESVNFDDISEIHIVALNKRSNGKNAYLTRPIPYLLIKTKSNKTKRFALSFMSKKTVLVLLNDLKEKIEIDINIDKLIKDFTEARFSVFEK